MKSDDIFKESVQVMKRLLATEGVTEAIKRARKRDAESNAALLDTYRERINDLVRSILEAEDPDGVLREAPPEVKDAMVIRYLKNRELFMQTFPDGIEGIDPDPAAIWGAIMISPQDETVRSG
jgi:hypothetical protein